jgi:NAD(P)-dependent dehydrogenase (short-subunit alcohol dehydrogenase family)
MNRGDFEEAMAIHHWGPFYAMQAAIPYMRQQGGGRIINISSVGGAVAVPHLAPYVASKFAFTGLSDAFRHELAHENILVTTVTPGLMRTGSHVNAHFRGDHRKEYAWFSILGANPLVSISSENAARQILEAGRYGRPSLVITPQARLLILANHLAPGLFSFGMRLFNRLLPKPALQKGDERRLGWDSRSRASPSFLTALADQAIGPNNEL